MVFTFPLPSIHCNLSLGLSANPRTVPPTHRPVPQRPRVRQAPALPPAAQTSCAIQQALLVLQRVPLIPIVWTHTTVGLAQRAVL
jgi:hypothetical protein